MRFISPYSAYRIIAKHQEVELLASGQPRVIAPGFTCEFRPDATDWERDVARETFSFTGAVTDEGGRDLDPITRVSSFDSSVIKNDVLRKEIEKRLLESDAYGHDYVMVEKPSLPPPWPTYDKTKGGGRGLTTAAVIAAKVEEDGHDVEATIAYERSNQNRSDVIEALEALTKVEEEEPLVAA